MENNTVRIAESVSATMETTKEKTKIQSRRGGGNIINNIISINIIHWE